MNGDEMISNIIPKMPSTYEELTEMIWRHQVELKTLLNKNEITKDMFYKCLVSLSYEFAVAGYPDDCLGILYAIEPNYFLNVYPNQCSEDAIFSELGSKIVEVLSKKGYTSKPTFLQSAAKA